jgi:hypothetical protein
MSTDRDTTRIVRSWLRAEEHESADRVLDSVLDQLDTTPQRRATWWPARRFPEMNNSAKLALAGLAVAVIALIGFGFLRPGGPSIGGPGPTVIPTPTASPMPLEGATDALLDAGTYVTTPFPAESMRFTLTFPAGWRAFTDFAFLPDGEGSSEAPDGMAFGFFQITGLYSDPCFASGVPNVAAGTTVDDLAAAFAEQTAYEVTGPTDITLAGFAGKRVDLELPSDFGTCGFEDYVPWPGSPYAQGPGNLWHVWMLDVEGTRVVVMTNNFDGTSAEDRAEQQAILDSLRIEP